MTGHATKLPFIRPEPAFLTDEEPLWLHAPPAVPLWRSWHSAEEAAAESQPQASAPSPLAALMALAVEGPLLPGLQQQVLSQIERNPGELEKCGLAPADVPAFVENNPAVAVEVLLLLLRGEGPSAEEFLAALAAMPLSLHGLEVVNRLTGAMRLPSQYMAAYVSNCLSSCQRAQARTSAMRDGFAEPMNVFVRSGLHVLQPLALSQQGVLPPGAQDKAVQNRLVRLVCVFLQSLIRSNSVNLEDLFLELQAFCISFSRVREAAALFRLLKTLEAGFE